MRDLSGKSVYDLTADDFEQLFCRRCVLYEACSKEMMPNCRTLVDNGFWYRRLEREDSNED